MLLDVLLVIVGLGLLATGGETLVRGAVNIARRFNITPAVIGLTVVAAGTSMPELWVSVGANLRGSPDFALGNVIGSNIFNIGLILGLTSIICVIPVGHRTLKLEWPFLLVITILASALMWGGSIGRWEGLLFVFLLAGFLWFMVRLTRRDADARETVEYWGGPGSAPAHSTLRAWGLVILGLVLLPIGADLVVKGATGIAQGLGVSERVIGITILAMGTSLPELASSLAAAARGRSDIAVGNVIGSNLFNTLGILGAAALARPLTIIDDFKSDIWWMLAFTVLLAPVLFFGRKVTRIDGIVLLTLFLVYMATLLRG
jgi:cation:H+ antiporter